MKAGSYAIDVVEGKLMGVHCILFGGFDLLFSKTPDFLVGYIPVSFQFVTSTTRSVEVTKKKNRKS